MELKELMTAFAETLGIEGIEVKEGVITPAERKALGR